MSENFPEYDAVIKEARDVFVKKMHDYGASWRVLRLPSITDQLFIKIKRIRTIDMRGEQKVDHEGDGISDEFTGILNYALMALIQLARGASDEADLSAEEAVKLYDEKASQARELMEKKNHDYGEAWRDMRISSMTDLIFTKLLRIREIDSHGGKTKISEGIDANFLDIVNYAIFARILLQEKK